MIDPHRILQAVQKQAFCSHLEAEIVLSRFFLNSNAKRSGDEIFDFGNHFYSPKVEVLLI
jgi:hypothetical protein